MSETYQSFEGTEKGQSFTLESNSRSVEQMAETLKPAEKAPETPEKPASEPEKDSEAHEAQEPAPVEGKQPEKPFRQIAKHQPLARMAEATRIAAEAKRERDEIQRRAEAAEAELQRFKAMTSGRPADAPRPSSDRPKLDDYDSIEDHAEAVANWVLKKQKETEAKAYQEYKERQSQMLSEKARDERHGKFAKVLMERASTDPKINEYLRLNQEQAEAGSFDPDFVINWTPQSRMKDPLQAGPKEVIAEYLTGKGSVGLDLLVYLQDNPQERTRLLSSSSPAELYEELGELKGRLSGATTATPQAEISKAAPPARPVTGGPPTGTPDPNKMTFEEYAKWQSLEDAKERKRRR